MFWNRDFKICDFYVSLSTRFVFRKACVGFSIVDFISYRWKFTFLLNKMYALFNSKRHKSFQNHNKRNPPRLLLPDLSCYKKFQNSVISARVAAPQKLTRRPIFKTSKSEVFKWKTEEIFDTLLLINLFIFLVGLRNIY